MKRRNKKEVEIVKEQEKEIINVVSAEKKGFNKKKTGIIIGAVIALVGAGVVIVKSLSGLEPTDYDLDDLDDFEEEDEDSEE